MLPAASAAESSARLARLEAYLGEDPDNPALLADACDTALAAGQHARALAHLAAAERLALDPAAWLWRRARLCIAQRDLAAAAESLEQLRISVGAHPVLDHDRAYVRFLAQDYEACRALVAPWLQDPAAGEHLEAVQVLWLRATHALGLIEEGWDWVNAQRNAGELGSAAQGIASLVAVDADDFTSAKTLADAALARHPTQSEALVARATVALAERDGPAATRWLALALQQNPDDGRTWSMLGLASLQAQQLSLSQSQLERAAALMPGHIGTWHALGWSRLLQRDQVNARKAFEQALALDGNFAESHGALGLVLALQGDAAQAERHLAIAGRLDPRNVSGRFAQALQRGEAADPERLQALVARLLDRPGLFGVSKSHYPPLEKQIKF